MGIFQKPAHYFGYSRLSYPRCRQVLYYSNIARAKSHLDSENGISNIDLTRYMARNVPSDYVRTSKIRKFLSPAYP